MKRALMAASIIVVLTAAQAFAQTVGVGPSETVVMEPRTLIRDYVVKERVKPITVKEEDLGRCDIACRRRTDACARRMGSKADEISVRFFR